MSFDIGIFKDAAEGIEKLVDAISKLGTALINGTKNSIELIDLISARNALARLNSFNTKLPRLIQTQTLLLRPALHFFLEDPSPKNWKRFISEAKKTLEFVDAIGKQLDQSSSVLATQPFYKDLIGAMMARKQALRLVIKSPAPKTPDQIDAVKDFLITYDRLIAELEKTADTLREYVARLQESGKTPSS